MLLKSRNTWRKQTTLTTTITICKAAGVKLDHDPESVTLACNNFLKGFPVRCNSGDCEIYRRVSVVVIRAGWRYSQEDGETNTMETGVWGEGQSGQLSLSLHLSYTSSFAFITRRYFATQIRLLVNLSDHCDEAYFYRDMWGGMLVKVPSRNTLDVQQKSLLN